MATSVTTDGLASATAMRRRLEQAVAVAGVVLLTGAVSSLREILFGGDPIQEGSDPLSRIAFLVLYMLVGAMLLTRWRRALPVVLAHWPLLLLVALTFASAAWSVDSGITIRRAIGVAGTTAFGLMLCVTFPLREWVGLLSLGIGIVAFLSVLVVALFPDYGIMTGLHEGAWRGILAHKNILGRTMALGVIAAAAWRPTTSISRVSSLATLIICFLLLVVSLSRAAWVVLAVVLFASALAGILRARLQLLLPVALGASCVLIASAYLLITTIDDLLLLLGRDLTFTGRTLIWLSLLSAIATRPLLGFGYGAFWSTEHGARLMGNTQPGFIPSHAHNGWLELAVGIGVVGVAVFGLSLLIVTIRAARAFRKSRNVEVYFPLMFLATLAALSMVESVFLRENNIFWAVYCATALAVSSRTRAQRSHKPW